MKDVIVGASNKQLFAVKNLSKFTDAEGDFLTSAEKLKFLLDSDNTGSFSNLLVFRLGDIELERVYFKNTVTGEEWDPETQCIGGTVVVPSNVKVFAHFESSSDVDIEDPAYDYDSNNVELYTRNGVQDSNIITEDTRKFRYHFSDGAFDKYSDITNISVDYLIQEISFTAGNIYENTDTQGCDIDIHITLKSGVTQDYNLSELPDYYSVKVFSTDSSEELTKWPVTQENYAVTLQLNYKDFSVNSDSVEVDIQPNKIESFVVYSQEVEKAFYDEAPQIKITEIIATRTSGNVDHKSDLNGIEGMTFDIVPIQYDSSGKGLLKKEVITTVHYSDETEVNSELTSQSLPFVACAKITDVEVSEDTPLEDQFSGKPLNIDDIEVVITFNVKNNENEDTFKSKTLLMSSYFRLHNHYGYIEDGIWFNPDTDGTYPLTYMYEDADTGEIIYTDFDFYLIRNIVILMDYKGNSTVILPSGSSFSDYRYRFPIDITFADFKTISTFPLKLSKDGIYLDNFEKFSDNESLDLSKRVYFNIEYFEGLYSFDELSETQAFIERTATKIEAFKSDNSLYTFEDDDQQTNSQVNISSLSYVVITFNDGSTYRVTLTDGNKIEQLSNNNITLYKTVWNYEHKQRNYLRFSNVFYGDKDYEFSTIFYNIQSVDLIRGERLFQNDLIDTDIDNKLVFKVEYRDSFGQRVINLLRRDEITKLGGILKTQTEERWPCDTDETAGNRSFFVSQMTFTLTPEKEEAFEDIVATFYNFELYRSPKSFELALTSTSEYTTSLKIDAAAIGDLISTADYGAKQKVTFYGDKFIESDEIDFDCIKTVEWAATSTINKDKIITKWPTSGKFALLYDEFDDNEHSVYARVSCDNMTSRVTKITATLNNNNIVAGSDLLTSYFDVKAYGLNNELMDIPDISSYIEVSPSETKSTDIVVTVVVSYTGRDEIGNTIVLKTQVSVPLLQKTCTLKYDIVNAKTNSSIKSYSTIATKYSYTPSLYDQEIQTKIEIPFTISGSCIYTFDSLEVVDSNDESVDGLTYDSINEILTIPANMDKNLKITFKYTTDYDTDSYGHAYSVTTEGELNAVYTMTGSKSTYRLPDSVSKIPYSNKVFNGNKSLITLIVPNSVERIDEQAFSNCTSLQSVTFERRTQDISIGRKAFYNCSNLHTLDFSNCGNIRNYFIIGTPDDDPIEGDVVMNTWEGCCLNRILIDKSSFSKYLRCHYIDNSIGHPKYWMTGRCGGGFRMQFEFSHNDNRETWLASVFEPGDGTGEPDCADVACYISGHGSWADNLYQKEFMTYNHSESHTEIINHSTSTVSGGYDFRDNCAGMIRSDRNANAWLLCYGLGYDDFDYYEVTSLYGANNKFTTNGRTGGDSGLEFISVESEKYGYDFDNWEKEEYVNDCIYPNVSLANSSMVHHDFTDSDIETFFSIGSSQSEREQFNISIGGTRLDLMIPVYSKNYHD